MADTDQVVPFVPNQFPALPGGEALFIMDELQKLQTAISSIHAVLVLLEARIVALEP